jgi:uncharacterized membrane protein YqjE
LDQTAQQAANPAAREPGLLEQAGALWAEIRGVAHGQFRLLALEARQAGARFAFMLALAVFAVALIATAWLGLVAVLVLLMMGAGMSLTAALLTAIALNLAAGAGCALLLRRHAREMPFAATLRSIRDGHDPA